MGAASLRVTPRHFVYLDKARTHEVHAEVEATPREDRLVTTEFPPGTKDPGEILQLVRRVTADAEVQLLVQELETRLRLTGNYFRANAADMRWAPLGPPPGDARVDLRSIELSVPGAAEGVKMSFHHFHAQRGDDLLLISMPRFDLDMEKHALAELSFRFPRVDVGDLSMTHTRLTRSTLRSALVQRHLELPREGFAKLLEPRDYHEAFGDGWLEQTRGMLGRAMTRMARGNAPEKILTHGGGAAPDAAADVVRALATHRIAELKARFLDEGEEALAMQGGEFIIKRLVNGKRRSTTQHTAAYELSVLESVLLAQYGVQNEVWSLVEEESSKLTRYVHGYA